MVIDDLFIPQTDIFEVLIYAGKKEKVDHLLLIKVAPKIAFEKSLTRKTTSNSVVTYFSNQFPYITCKKWS